MRKISLSVFLLMYTAAILAAGEAKVYLADSSVLFTIRGNEIFSPNGNVLLSYIKGNIVFRAGDDSKENIELMFSSPDIFSERKQSATELNIREPIFCYQNGRVYLCNNESQLQESVLIYATKFNKWLAFYSELNDSLLAYYKNDSIPSSVALWIANTLLNKYRIDLQAVQVKSVAPTATSTSDKLSPTYSYIKPFWGNQTANEWMWDGQILRLRWNPDPRFAWTFDGQTLRPYIGSNIYEQYSWDGEIFKPVWRTSRDQEWSYDGRILKPIWSTDWANQYNIQQGMVKPWSNVHTEKEWQIQGEIPIPVIIAVISGIARPY
jgi:hypothetical protein